MRLRKIVTLATTGTAAVGMSLLSFGATAAHAANGVEPVTFSVTAGSLALAQAPDAGTALVDGTPVNLPQATVTDGRNDTGRTGSWNVTSTASDLTEVGGGVITAGNIALAHEGSFTTGSGTQATTTGSFLATSDSIGSVYSYTPTATLAVPAHSNSGGYAGTITQTVV